MHIKFPETKRKSKHTHPVMTTMMMLFIIIFIYCVYVCVQNICFCGFYSADFYLSFMNNFAIVICSCFSFHHSFNECVYLLRPMAGCALLLLAILFLMSFTLITINNPRVGLGAKKGHHSFRTFPHLHEFIVFTIGSPLFVISWVCSLFFLLFDICICSLCLTRPLFLHCTFMSVCFGYSSTHSIQQQFECSLQQQQQQQRKKGICYFYRYFY